MGWGECAGLRVGRLDFLRSTLELAEQRPGPSLTYPSAGAAAAVTGTFLVGKAGLEPAASASRTLRATKLRHFPETPAYFSAAGP
jgi:hypothetical protein